MGNMEEKRKIQRILVTGPDGFVGSILCCELITRGYSVRGAQWITAPLPDGCESVVVGDIGTNTDWSDALKDVDAIVHLAARVHMMHDQAVDPLLEFRRVNVEGTKSLAEAAAKAGIRRFILMSSIKVNGESSDVPFTESDQPKPLDAYGVSKWEAECIVRDIGQASGFDFTILRAPLIYGPGVKGNFLSLLKLARSSLPLPFGGVHNQRSLLYVGNLIDFILQCMEHPNAANELFLISDGTDLSTSDLLREIRKAMQKSSRLFSVSPSILYMLGRIVNKAAIMERLCGSLRVDSSKARKRLAWEPPFTISEGLRETLRSFV